MKVSSLCLSFAAWSLLAVGLVAENEIGFIERFALAPDRESVLGQLVPGTEDHYYFQALHFQNTRQREKMMVVMRQWAARFPDSPRRRVIENREALMNYEADPQGLLSHLQERLHPFLSHTQEVPDRKPNLPSVLDPAVIGRDVFLKAVLSSDVLEGMDPLEFPRLIRDGVKVNPAQRRHVLSQLGRPDVPGLVEWIVADLKTSESRGFGEFGIHNQLLPEQLDQLRQAIPDLEYQQAFVFARLRRLAPGADSDAAFEPLVREAWLDRLWNASKGLPPAFNSLKAHILRNRLVLDRTRGVYDRQRFMEYLKLPRPMPYMNPRYLQKVDGGRYPVDLNASFDFLSTGAVPVGSDEGLIREFVLHFSKTDSDWEPWAEWLNDAWLKPVFAEAKITSGSPDAEKWASWLTPVAYQALRDRVDVDIAPTNPERLLPADDVSLEVFLKNTPKVIVRVFEINTLGYFMGQDRQLNTDLNLDGLVANAEQTLEGDPSPFLRVRRTLTFPELKGRRGAWILEVIGGGKSSRALIRKGQYSLVQQTGPAGEWLTVIDESRHVVSKATAWLDGRRFDADPKEGRILIPFTAQPRRRNVVLADAEGGFASLAALNHTAEHYRLDAQFHVEREQLLPGREATLMIRANLLLGSSPVAPGLMKDPILVVTTTTLDGIQTTAEVKNPKLESDRVLGHTIRIPDRLAQLQVTLRGKVDLLSKAGGEQSLEASQSWNVNGIQKTEAVLDAHLSHIGSQRVLEVLGRNGEPAADQTVQLIFRRFLFSRTESVSLRTDEKGRIQLGQLEGIASLEVRLADGRSRNWAFSTEERTWPEGIQLRAGEKVLLPWGGAIEPGAVSLLEVRGGLFVSNRTSQVKWTEGFLDLGALEPGDYSLELRNAGVHPMTIRIVAGDLVSGWVVGTNRSLQRRDGAALQIVSTRVDTNTVTVQLAQWDAWTRVHVAANRFQPSGNLWTGLSGFDRPATQGMTPDRLPNLFSSGRNIGDEYRYILERRYATQYPGNFLIRPGLLLNPWEVRPTDARAAALEASEAPGATAGAMAGRVLFDAMQKNSMPIPIPVAEPSYDFLAAPAPVLLNLRPDRQGVVRIPYTALGDRQTFQIYAENLTDAVWRSFSVEERPTALRDLRLVQSLDPARPVAETKDSMQLKTGEVLEVADAMSEELEIYDTLSSVHALLTTLSQGNPDLAKFAWILQWPQLTEAQRRTRYSDHACHELNFFLSRKDPKFFAEVVRPLLQNKKDPTFLDDYLLEKDLKRYLEPWAYGRLNVVEQALLARRLPEEAASTARRLRELWEVLPVQPENRDRWFETALRGRLLERSRFGKVPVGGAAAAVSNVPVLSEKESLMEAKTKDSKFGRGIRRDVLRRENLDKFEAANRLESQQRMSMKLTDGPVAMDSSLGDKPELGLMFAQELREKSRKQSYYQPVGPTLEWAENNYYHRPMSQQDASLVTINAFWRDYATWDGKPPFVSPNVTEAHRNFTEMMFVLAVLDLPFVAPQHDVRRVGPSMTFKAAGPLLIFRKHVSPVSAAGSEAGSGVLVSEAFFRQGDRYREEGTEKFDKFVTGEFLSGVVYGGQVVVSNPGSTPVKVELLTQVPQGSIPVMGSRWTQGHSLKLEPYTTQRLEYHFYFPTPETAAQKHLPAQVSMAGRSVGAAQPTQFQVVRRLSKVDTASWEYISQQGQEAEVFAYLDSHNLARINLERIAWRCRDSADFFRRITTYLARQHVWSEPIYRYALKHNDPTALRKWLRHADDYVSQCGDWLDSKLIRLDPVERHAYEQLEYSPLVNARAHRVGAERRIDNASQRNQYQRLLTILSQRPKLDAADHLAVVYHLFLQDRVEEALVRLKDIRAEELATRLQYDYFQCYAAFYRENISEARSIAKRHSQEPVDRWRALFAEVLAQADEIEGKKAVRPNGVEDRESAQSSQAATEPTFDFKVENRTIQLSWRNLPEIRVNYYLMDPEFLFSSSPFVTQDPARFSIIKPTESAVLKLPSGKNTLETALPARFSKANVLVELVGAGKRQTQAYHSSSFKLLVAENQGRLDLQDITSSKAVSKAYVKVYARLPGGTIRFYKDGYTDLRGRFDYASLNESAAGGGSPGPLPDASGGTHYQAIQPGEVAKVEKFAVLVLSETHGASVRELDPPRR